MKKTALFLATCILGWYGASPCFAGPVAVTACGTLSPGTASSYVLTRDLKNANGTCLTIAGDNVTLDLQGHKISASEIGIEVNGKDVVIKNGTVVGCGVGIRLFNSGIIDRMVVSECYTGIVSVPNNTPFVVRDSRFLNNTAALTYGGGYAQVVNNQFVGTDGSAIYANTVIGLVKGNTFADNAGFGINNCYGFAGKKSGQIVDNHFDGNAAGGICISMLDGMIEGNTILSSGRGILFAPSSGGNFYRNNTIAHSTVTNVQDDGTGNIDAGGNVMY